MLAGLTSLSCLYAFTCLHVIHKEQLGRLPEENAAQFGVSRGERGRNEGIAH